MERAGKRALDVVHHNRETKQNVSKSSGQIKERFYKTNVISHLIKNKMQKSGVICEPSHKDIDKNMLDFYHSLQNTRR
jgi:hypothetical protein